MSFFRKQIRVGFQYLHDWYQLLLRKYVCENLCFLHYVCMYVCMCIRTYVCACVCMYVCMYVCIYVCMYMYVNLHLQKLELQHLTVQWSIKHSPETLDQVYCCVNK